MKEIDWGSHTVFIADVVDTELADGGRPLIYTQRSYATPQARPTAAAR